MKVVLRDRDWPDLDIERSILDGHELVEDAVEPDAAAILTYFARVSASEIVAARDLRVIARFGTGVDMIDVAAARARGIPVCNVPDYCTEEVAEHTIALLLALARRVVDGDAAVRSGAWVRGLRGAPHRLGGKTLGVIGFGKTGRRVRELAEALGMRVLVHSRHGGGGSVPLDDLLSSADAVTVHLPLDDTTRGLVDETFVRRMRPGAFLVNVARGRIWDEAAVARALDDGHLAGAAADVFPHEPPPDSPLVTSSRTVLTPHIAYRSPESVALMRRLVCEDVARVLRGEPPLRTV